MLLWQLCFSHTCPIYDQPRANRRFPMFERACLPIGDWPIIYSIYSIMGRVICFFLTQSATLPAKKQNLSQPLWVCLPWGSVPFKTGVVGQISKPWDSQVWAMFKTNCPISFWEKTNSPIRKWYGCFSNIERQRLCLPPYIRSCGQLWYTQETSQVSAYIHIYIYIYSVYIHKLSKPPKCMAKLTILEFSMFTVIQTNMTDSVGPLVSQVADHQAHHGHSRGPSWRPSRCIQSLLQSHPVQRTVRRTWGYERERGFNGPRWNVIWYNGIRYTTYLYMTYPTLSKYYCTMIRVDLKRWDLDGFSPSLW